MHRVLLVDNEPWILESLAKRIAWAEAGCEVAATAQSAQAALDGIGAWVPQIVCTDIRMPGMDGLDFLAALKARDPDLEVIMVTGYADFEYARTAMNRGASGFCLKPVDRAEMLALLQKAAARIEARNRLAGTAAGPDLGPLGRFLPLVPVAVRTLGSGPPVLPHARTAPVALDGRTWLAGFEAGSAKRLGREAAGWPSALGLSDVVLGPVCQDQASLEAAAAVLHGLAYDSFLTGRTPAVTAEIPDRGRAYTALKDLGAALQLMDWTSVRRLLDGLRRGFEEGLHPVDDVLLLENQVRLSLALHAGTPDRNAGRILTYQALAGAYPSASDLVRTLEAQLSEAQAAIERSLAARSSSPLVREVVGLLGSRYMEPLTLDDLASAVGVSAGHLGKLFIKETGMSVGDFLAGIRIGHAKVLLEKSRDSIEDIGTRCGYPDYYYFCKVFKKVTGVPPGAWRSQRKS